MLITDSTPAALKQSQSRIVYIRKDHCMISRFLLAACLGLALHSFPLSAGPGDAWTARIDKRLERMRPSKDERKFDLIAWAPSLRDAIAAAKASNRPVFLFTHDGHINTGRC
jgi:hypothetical protein